MKTLKRGLGYFWMILGPAAIIFLTMQAIDKVGLVHDSNERVNTILQWGIILFIFIPICAGLVIFGRYASKGEYDVLEDLEEEL